MAPQRTSLRFDPFSVLRYWFWILSVCSVSARSLTTEILLDLTPLRNRSGPFSPHNPRASEPRRFPDAPIFPYPTKPFANRSRHERGVCCSAAKEDDRGGLQEAHGPRKPETVRFPRGIRGALRPGYGLHVRRQRRRCGAHPPDGPGSRRREETGQGGPDDSLRRLQGSGPGQGQHQVHGGKREPGEDGQPELRRVRGGPRRDQADRQGDHEGEDRRS